MRALPPSRRLRAVVYAPLAFAAGVALASEPPRAIEAPAAKASAAARAAATGDPNRLPRGAPDPLEHLRKRLAEKLGATASPTSPNPNVLHVGARSGVDTPAAKVAARPVAAHPAAPHAAHWSYDGPGGPQQWAALKPEYAACAKGQRQSPIDLREAIRVDLEPIAFQYRPGAFRVLDNGHTVQVNVAPGNTIEVRGRRFELVQFHFHRPSEETIDGRRFDMSLHLVHRDAAGKLAVVGLLLDAGAPQPTVQQVWNNLPLERGEEVPARAPLDPASLLPAARGYFATMGSLTTPPCDEGVLWMVMQQPVSVSPEQIAIFSRLYPMNARPLQPSSGRLIQASN